MMAAPAMLTVVARWQVPAAALAEVLGLVTQLQAASLAEPGCRGYEVFRGLQDGAAGAATLLLLEHYQDDAALQAHRQAPHYQALVAGRILPLLAGRRVEILQPQPPG